MAAISWRLTVRHVIQLGQLDVAACLLLHVLVSEGSAACKLRRLAVRAAFQVVRPRRFQVRRELPRVGEQARRAADRRRPLQIGRSPRRVAGHALVDTDEQAEHGLEDVARVLGRVRPRGNVAEARQIREELKQCYYREGVNHYQNCRELVQTYLAKIQAHDFGSAATAAQGF